MKHLLENNDLLTQLVVDETLCENTSIAIHEEGVTIAHYLTPKELNNLIGVLLHIQAKKRKQGKNFDRLSNSF